MVNRSIRLRHVFSDSSHISNVDSRGFIRPFKVLKGPYWIKFKDRLTATFSDIAVDRAKQV